MPTSRARRRVPLSVCFFVFSCAGALVSSCKDHPTREGSPPPPVPSPAERAAGPVACADGGGRITDNATAAIFPREVAGYCVDPNGETRVFGEGGALSMDAVCTDAFDGECEVYKSFGLKRVVNLRYSDGAGSPGTVEVYLSKFATVEGAYAMYTKRIVADGDPAEGVPREVATSGAGSIGTGRAYVWKGQLLAEIQYANEQETPTEMKASSDRILLSLAKGVGDKLPGAPGLPAAAARLPAASRLPQGLSFAAKDVLGVDGAGVGAVGFYREGEKRFRIVSIVRDDVEQAKDTLKTLSKQKGAAEEKGLGEGAYRFVLSSHDGVKTEWIVARSGKNLVGVGDEEFVLRGGIPATERDKVSLPRDEKLKRLRGSL